MADDSSTQNPADQNTTAPPQMTDGPQPNATAADAPAYTSPDQVSTTAPLAPGAQVPSQDQQRLQQQEQPEDHVSGGLGGRVRGFGQGFVLGGIPGAIAGAINPGLANNAFQQRQKSAQAGLDIEQANAAMQHVALAKAQHELMYMPADKQEAMLRTGAQNSVTMIDKQVVVPVTETTDYGTALNRLQELITQNPSQSYTLLPMTDAKGGIGYQVASVPHAPLKEAVTFTLPDGTTMTAPKGMPAGVANQMYMTASAQHFKVQNQIYAADQKARDKIAINHENVGTLASDAGQIAKSKIEGQEPALTRIKVAGYLALNRSRYTVVTDPNNPTKNMVVTMQEAHDQHLSTPTSPGASALKAQLTKAQPFLVYFDTAANHLDLVRRAGMALQNGDYPTLNHIANMYSVAVGKDPVTTFRAITTVAAPEIVKASSGTGQMSKEEIELARSNFSDKLAPNQITNNAGAMINLMDGKKKALFDNLENLSEMNKSKTTVVPKGTPKPGSKAATAPKTADEYLQGIH